MRTAVVSDIHGNFQGLLRVFRDIEAQQCNRIVCLGDLVEGGEENEEVVAEIRRRDIPTVRGNHDENNSLTLSTEAVAFLLSLPDSLCIDGMFLTHISPRGDDRKINSRPRAWNVFEETPHRLMFVGHLHIPFIFGSKSEEPCTARLVEYTYNRPIALDPEERHIVSPGAVGYPRDGVALLRYAIFDSSAQSLEIRSVAGPLLPLGAWC